VSYKDKKFGFRNYEILAPVIWADTITDIFLKAHKRSCDFIYKRGKVSHCTMNSQYYIWFCATCKDCYAEMEKWADTEPLDAQLLVLNFLINDTRG